MASDDAAPASPWPPKEFVLPLRTAVKDDEDRLIQEITLREPTLGEWEQIMDAPVDRRRGVAVSVITGLRPGIVKLIAIGDILQAEDYLWAFFQVGEAIRAWSPPSSPPSSTGAPTSSES